MANPFDKAAKKAQANGNGGSKPKKEQNIIEVKDETISTAIDEFIEADDREKLAKADKDVAKAQVLPTCLEDYFQKFAQDKRKPSTMKFRSQTGKTVSLVIQDRGERNKVSEEQEQTLVSILGKKKAESLILRDMLYSFNNEILNRPGVMEAIGQCLDQLVKDGTLTQDEQDQLIEADSRVTIRKGVVDDLADLCKDANAMEQLHDALNSPCHMSSYIKA
jgi:hypothetical protein